MAGTTAKIGKIVAHKDRLFFSSLLEILKDNKIPYFSCDLKFEDREYTISYYSGVVDIVRTNKIKFFTDSPGDMSELSEV